MDGPGGFHLATDIGTAAFFAGRLGEGTIVRYTFTTKAIYGLTAAGATVAPISGTRMGTFPGNQFVIPTSAFPVFNGFLQLGQISPSPAGL